MMMSARLAKGAASRSEAKGAPKAMAASRPKPQPAEPIELPEGMWEQIAKKAYELYEQRGRQDGRALADWLEAEAIVMEEIHEARE
jgi:hypothetical protein